MTGSFAGKVVLVTGGARGVGRCVTEEFAARDAHVVVNCFHSPAAAHALVDSLTARGRSAQVIQASVAKADQVERMLAQVQEEHGGLDVLVNNAARGAFLPLGELTEDDWQRTFDLNLHAVRHCCLAALPLLASRPGSSVVNISSHGAAHAVPDYGVVGASKAAMESLSRYLAVEFAPHGVRVNVAGSPLMDNRVADLFPGAEGRKEATRDATPWGRLPTERDLARLVTLLASDDAGFVTGQTVWADGGLSCGAALHAPLPRRRRRPDRPERPAAAEDAIAVVGTGLLLPGAETPEEFWELLCAGKPVFTDQSRRYPMEHFHSPDPDAEDRTYTRLAGIVDRPGQESADGWLRHAARQALGGVPLPAGTRTTVVAAGWPDGTRELEEGALRELLVRQSGEEHGAVRALLGKVLPHASDAPGDYLAAPFVRRALAGLVPESADVLAVDAACASGLYALDLAARALRDGAADTALAVGLCQCTTRYMTLFAKVRGLSSAGDVRAFDADADGTLFADAVAAVALKRLGDAERDGDQVLAVLDGFGASSDGRGKAISAPNPAGQRFALRRARRAAGTDEVDWIVAHATGTPAGDRAELLALAAEPTPGTVLCTGNKSLVGHGSWSSGLVSVIHAVLGLRHGTVPAQARCTVPADSLPDRISVPLTPGALPPGARRVGVSAFGFGGVNAHQILTDRTAGSRAPARVRDASGLVLVGWSALLPGAGDSAAALGALCAGEHARGFGDEYPAPPFEVVRLPPRTVRAMDRTQLMALQLADRLITDHGTLWADVADTTCVVAAHCGPTRLSQEISVRCFASAVDAQVDADWWRGHRDALRERVAPVSEDTLPGLLPNVVAGRIAARHDLHGPSLTTDTGRSALTVAERYLRDGDCELALLVAVHGNTLPGCGGYFGVADEEVCEGGFLLALTTAERAAQREWRVLAEVPEARETPEPGRCYGGAQEVAGLLRGWAADGTLGALDAAAAGPLDSAPPVSTSQDTDRPRLLRYELTADPALHADHRHAPVPALPGGCLVVTDDATVAEALRPRVRAVGGTLLVTDPSAPQEQRITGDEEAFVARLRGLPRAPEHLRVFVRPARTPWPARPSPALLTAQEVTFLALRELREGLCGGGSAAVCLLDPQTGGAAHPHGALFTGMVKSAVWDLPGAWLHALTTDAPLPEALEQLAKASRDRPEIPASYLRHGLRHTETLRPDDTPPVEEEWLGADSVVVAAGGARGITAALLKRLAGRHRCHLWLIGSSDLDALAPSARTGTDSRFAAGRREFIAEQLAGRATPAEAVRRFDRLAAAREAARTVDVLSALSGPGRVRYLCADITDPERLGAAVRRIAAAHGTVDLLINAAGVNRAGDIATKSLAAFRRVRDVKLLGYHSLREAFAALPVRHWCNFGSLSGVIGLPGEVDYAAANDLLSAAARAGGPEEFTVAWTLWTESGMATRSLVGDVIRRRGHLSSLTDDEGARHFAQLLRRPARLRPPGVVQVGAGERRFMAPVMPRLARAPEASAPFGAYLGTPRLRGIGVAEWDLVFTPDQVERVREHPVRGLPTLPGTLVLALLAEAAAALAPGSRADVVRDVRFHRFIRVRPDSPVRYGVRAELVAPATVRVTVTSDTFAPGGGLLRGNVLHTEAVVELDARPPAPPVPAPRRGEPAHDPYYEPGSPIALRGAFVNTTDHRAGPAGGSSVWRPRAEPAPSFYGRMHLPALLVDALARTHALRAPGTPAALISAPTALERLELHRHGNDTDLFHACPDGLRLLEDRPKGCFHALTHDGEPVLSFKGLRIHTVGTVDVTGTENGLPRRRE